MKILTILGARPQIIKAAMFSKKLANLNLKGSNQINEKILHTGQHYNYELSQQIIEQLNLPAPYLNLEIGSGTHAKVTGEMMTRMEEQVLKEEPDWVLLYGDTNSTLAGALTAAKLGSRVCHIEAGLRSYNRQMPEEINRVLIDHVSDLLFAPTKSAVKNLYDENIKQGVFHTGDIMYDAAFYFSNIADKQSNILERLCISEFLLATVHRQENTDVRAHLSSIVRSFDEIATTSCPLILPIHPRTEKMLDHFNISFSNDNVKVLQPVSFIDMIKLEKNAKAILTDSGGIQKEAYFHKTPCITLRNETEWIETVESGWNQVAGVGDNAIVAAMANIQEGKNIDDYGDGNSAGKMVEILLDY